MTSRRSFINLRRENIKHRIGMILITFFFFFLAVLSFLMIIQNICSRDIKAEKIMEQITDLARPEYGMAFVALGAALLLAVSSFKYLHSRTEVDFYHSLPIKRTEIITILLTNDLMLFVVPLVLVTAFKCIVTAAAGCKTYFNKKDHLWTLYDYETGAFKIPGTKEEGMIYGGCNCGNCHITILPTGDIFACRRSADSKVGNVFRDRLADVWVCEMEAYRDYKKFEKCSRCELLAFCRGCPAVAKGTSGNFYAADPQCWKTNY